MEKSQKKLIIIISSVLLVIFLGVAVYDVINSRTMKEVYSDSTVEEKDDGTSEDYTEETGKFFSAELSSEKEEADIEDVEIDTEALDGEDVEVDDEETDDKEDAVNDSVDNDGENYDNNETDNNEAFDDGNDDETVEDDPSWCLLLVNKDNPVPDDFEVQLMDLSNGKQVDERIYPQLQAMFDDARSQGLDLFVREGYRTREDQQSIMDNRIQSYIAEGNSEADAIALAKQYVAEPGTSEHELGISVDINANGEVCSEDAVYTWLYDNAYKYGFVKRYPENKIDITGINNEPWHYRYVGKDAAKIMKDNDLCLEEYLDMYGE